MTFRTFRNFIDHCNANNNFQKISSLIFTIFYTITIFSIPHSLIFLLAINDSGSRGLLIINIMMMKFSSYSNCQPGLQRCPQLEEAPHSSLSPLSLWTLRQIFDNLVFKTKSKPLQ